MRYPEGATSPQPKSKKSQMLGMPEMARAKGHPLRAIEKPEMIIQPDELGDLWAEIRCAGVLRMEA